MPVGKSSRKKKVSIDQGQSHQGGRKQELKPLQESPTGSLYRTTSLAVYIPVFILLLVSFAVYFNALSNGFVYDDMGQVLKNPWIKDVRYLPDIFLKSTWSFLSEYVVSNYYRPLMHLIYMINYHVFGLSPWGFHLINVLIHSGVSVLIFLLSSRLLKEYSLGASSPPGSFKEWMAYSALPPFIPAILFAVHPIHTEAVTWIAGIPDLSCTFFYLLSLYLYVIAGDKGFSFRGIGIYLSSVSFLLACFSKETALTLPIILFAYDLTVSSKKNWKRYIPYIVISAGYLFIRQHALSGFAPERRHEELSTYQVFINVFPLFAQYLYKLVLPINLNAFYVLHPIRSILGTTGIVSLAISVGFMILLFIAFKKGQKAVFFSLCLIVVPLLPVFYIPVLGENTFTERYLYLPSVGFVFVLGICFCWLSKRLPRFGLATVFAMILIGLYSVQSVERNQVWADNLSLFSDTVRKSPDSRLAHELLGTTLLYADRNDEALEQYEIAQRIGPPSAIIYRNRGLLYMNRGLLREAAAEFQKALQIDSDNPDTHYKLGLVYAKLGMRDEAMKQYGIFIESNKDSADVYVRVGIDMGQAGMERDATAMFEKALRLEPDNVDAHYNLGNAFANSGQLGDAIEHFMIAVRLQPDNPFLHNALGVAYEKKGLYIEAVEQYKAAVRLSPGEPIYRSNLERVNGLKEEAGRHKTGNDMRVN